MFSALLARWSYKLVIRGGIVRYVCLRQGCYGWYLNSPHQLKMPGDHGYRYSTRFNSSDRGSDCSGYCRPGHQTAISNSLVSRGASRTRPEKCERTLHGRRRLDVTFASLSIPSTEVCGVELPRTSTRHGRPAELWYIRADVPKLAIGDKRPEFAGTVWRARCKIVDEA